MNSITIQLLSNIYQNYYLNRAGPEGAIEFVSPIQTITDTYL